jgi:hypothetical protein
MKKPKRKEPHPTLFVFEGSIRYYQNGSMLELYSQITNEEWEMIIDETIHFKCFIECLKNVAYPILDEIWTKEDEWFLLQMNVAISRLRNIDNLYVAKYDEKKIKKIYSKIMKKNANSCKEMIKATQKAQKEFIRDQLKDQNIITVTDL